MSPLKLRLIEDRAMRDAARAVVDADIARLKDGVQTQGLGARAAEAGSDYLRTIGEGALDLMREEKAKAGTYAALGAAALAAWLFRGQIAEAMCGLWEGLSEQDPEDSIPNQDTSDDISEQDI